MNTKLRKFEDKNNPFNKKDISFRQEYFFCSNLYPCNISYENLIFPSAEHLYQYLKVADTEKGNWWKEKILTAKYPKIAKKLGGNKNLPLKYDFENNKEQSFNDFRIEIMKITLKHKFFHSDQSNKLQKLLLETGNIEIIEKNNWKDIFFGVYSKTNMGKNILGELLMEIRTSLLSLELEMN